jgi:hypothetical protein
VPDVSVIQQFLHPPLGVLSIEALSGNPYSGYNLLTRTAGPIGVNAFGLMWATETWPAGYGAPVGTIAGPFDRVMLKIVVFHVLFDTTGVRSQIINTREQTGFVLFDESFPFSVGTEWSPGVTGSFYWLLVG